MKRCAEAAVRLTELTISWEWQVLDLTLSHNQEKRPAFGFSAAGYSNRRFRTPSQLIKVSRFWWESVTSNINWWDVQQLETSSDDSGGGRKTLPLFFVALTVLWRILASLLFSPGFAFLPVFHVNNSKFIQFRLDNHLFFMAELAGSVRPLNE
jgi:hypothetical protein